MALLTRIIFYLAEQEDPGNTKIDKVFKSFVSHVDSHKAHFLSCHLTSEEAKKNGQEKEPRQAYKEEYDFLFDPHQLKLQFRYNCELSLECDSDGGFLYFD